MALVRKDLYKDLISVRAALYEELKSYEDRVSRTEAEIKEKEDSIANFDKTQEDLKNSIDELEVTKNKAREKVEVLFSRVEAVENDIASNKEEQQAKEEEIKANQTKLKEAQDEGRPAEEIKALQEKIIKLLAELQVLQQRQDTLEKELNSLYQQVAINKELERDSEMSIEESLKQFSENEEQNEENKEVLPKLKTELEEFKERRDKSKAEYTDFITKNQGTINTFEAQQLVRDSNIPKENPAKAFNRVPDNAGETVESNDILSNVVKEELKPANPQEEDQRSTWVEAGRKEDINPDFLTAAEASRLAFASMWSTKIVATAIKQAAENGELKIKFASLSNNLIYALQSAGYAIYLTDIANENSHIIVSWENLGEAK
jgi:chromosome segregation ATPase